MNETIIGYIVIVVLSIITGFLGREVLHYRKSVDTTRRNNNDTERRASESLDTITEIRKNQRIDEQGNNSRNHCYIHNITDYNILGIKE